MKFTSMVFLTIQLLMAQENYAKIIEYSHRLHPFLGAVYFQPELGDSSSEDVQIWRLTANLNATVELLCVINIPETLACTDSSLTVFVNGVGKKFCGRTTAYFSNVGNSIIVVYRRQIRGYLLVLDPFYCKADSHFVSYPAMFWPQKNNPIYTKKYSLLTDDTSSGVSLGRMLTNCPCGWANRRKKNVNGGRLVGGEEYQVNEYPFIVQLFNSLSKHPYCAGTIITPSHVLTAGHCAFEYRSQPHRLGIGAGTHDNSARSPSSLQLNTAQYIIVHEEFQIGQYGLIHDIAILVVTMPFRINIAVGPTCFPFPHWNLTGQRVRILGWGARSFKSSMSPRPQKVDMMVVDQLSCKNHWGHSFISPSSHLCTQARNKSTCQGDSGGPVLWLDPETNRYTLVGIVSYGPDCGDQSPSVQTDVTAHLPWIFRWVRATNVCTRIAV